MWTTIAIMDTDLGAHDLQQEITEAGVLCRLVGTTVQVPRSELAEATQAMVAWMAARAG